IGHRSIVAQVPLQRSTTREHTLAAPRRTGGRRLLKPTCSPSHHQAFFDQCSRLITTLIGIVRFWISPKSRRPVSRHSPSITTSPRATSTPQRRGSKISTRPTLTEKRRSIFQPHARSRPSKTDHHPHSQPCCVQEDTSTPKPSSRRCFFPRVHRSQVL